MRNIANSFIGTWTKILKEFLFLSYLKGSINGDMERFEVHFLSQPNFMCTNDTVKFCQNFMKWLEQYFTAQSSVKLDRNEIEVI
jgi:hypothetical protein